jgi:transcriptional regulator with XRE-family HTH domain
MDSIDLPIVEVMAASYEQRARERIKRWIQTTGMTQLELAERIGRNQEWVSRYLSGKINADMQTLDQMAVVFGHHLIALLDLPKDPDDARLIELFRSLPPAARTSLLDFLTTYQPAAGPPKVR